MAARMVALLRGINVGKAKRVAMADLRRLVEDLGCRDVQTLLNSGNVVLTAPRGTPAALADKIEKQLVDHLGIASRVTVVTAEALAEAVTRNPLPKADNPSRFLVAFFSDPAAARKKLAPLTRQDWAPEAFALGGSIAYLWCPGGILASALGGAVNRAMGEGITSRNWATVLKLHAMAQCS